MVSGFCLGVVVFWMLLLYMLEQLLHWLGERRSKRAR